METVAFCVSVVQDVMRMEYGCVCVPGIERPTLPVVCVSPPLRMTAEYLLNRVLEKTALSVAHGVSSSPQFVSGYALLEATYMILLYTPSGISVVHSQVKQCVSVHPRRSARICGVSAEPTRMYA